MSGFPIADALIRANKLRILALEEALSRDWHPDDPLRRELEVKLVREQNSLTERLRFYP